MEIMIIGLLTFICVYIYCLGQTYFLYVGFLMYLFLTNRQCLKVYRTLPRDDKRRSLAILLPYLVLVVFVPTPWRTMPATIIGATIGFLLISRTATNRISRIAQEQPVST